MRTWLAFCAIAAITCAVSWAPRGVVYGGPDVRLLGDTDPHYHVLRAERLLRGDPAAWRDPSLDSPNGAEVPWPPLFDELLVMAARSSGATTRDEIARAAAPVPALLGLVLVLSVAVVGRSLIGPRGGLAAAAVVALLPAVAQYSLVGRVDQHVAEVLFATILAGAFVRGLERDALDALAVAGVSIAIVLSFWTWMGSALSLVPPAATVALARITAQDALAGRGARTLAAGAGIAALALIASIALFAPPGALRSASLLGIGGFHAALVTGVAGFSAILAVRSSRAAPTWARAGEVAVAVAVPAALLFWAWPGLLEGVRRGVVALGAANPWYAEIREYQRALFGGLRPPWIEARAMAESLGLVPALALLAIPAAFQSWKRAPAMRPKIFFLAVWAGSTLLFALARNRFFPYFAAPGTFAAMAGASWCSDRILRPAGRTGFRSRVLASVIVAIALVPTAGWTSSLAHHPGRVPDSWIDAARWLRTGAVPEDGRTTVAAPWSLGHLVQYYADRPVVVTPFGTEAGPRALPDWARFLFTTDESAAESVLLARRVGHVVIENPSHELVGLAGFRPEGEPLPLVVTRSVWAGEQVRATLRYRDLFVSRLYFEDGRSAGGDSAAGVRLVYEGPSTRPPHPLLEERHKIFGVVAGATVRVGSLRPGAAASASIDVLTNTGRTFTWVARRYAAATGVAEFRVPYATGVNGSVVAGPCVIEAGGRRAEAVVRERDVDTGGVVQVAP